MLCDNIQYDEMWYGGGCNVKWFHEMWYDGDCNVKRCHEMCCNDVIWYVVVQWCMMWMWLAAPSGIDPSSVGVWRGACRYSWHRQCHGAAGLCRSRVRQFRRHHAVPGAGWVFLRVGIMPHLVLGESFFVLASYRTWSWVSLSSCWHHAAPGAGWVFLIVGIMPYLVLGESFLMLASSPHGHGFVLKIMSASYLTRSWMGLL